MESPGRDLFLCGILGDTGGYPADFSAMQRKYLLVSTLVNSVLALLSDRLLLLHCALVTSGTEGHVLVGRSGVGKSTAASRVPPPWRAPADDMVAAVRTEGGYVLHPLPTWSQLIIDPDRFRVIDVNERYSLSGIHFLEQSPMDRIDPIMKADAAERLLRFSYHAYKSEILAIDLEWRLRCKLEVLKHATAITDQVPVDTLRLSREGRFWELLSSS